VTFVNIWYNDYIYYSDRRFWNII